MQLGNVVRLASGSLRTRDESVAMYVAAYTRISDLFEHMSQHPVVTDQRDMLRLISVMDGNASISLVMLDDGCLAFIRSSDVEKIA